MTPSEQKIYDEVVKIGNQQAMQMERIGNLKEDVSEHEKKIETLTADRNKVIGISWLGGGLLAIGSLIYEIFKHS